MCFSQLSNLFGILCNIRQNLNPTRLKEVDFADNNCFSTFVIGVRCCRHEAGSITLKILFEIVQRKKSKFLTTMAFVQVLASINIDLR